MKKGKTVGPDDILVDIWKSLGEKAVEFLTKWLNMILDTENMFEEWRKSVFVPVFKKRDDVQNCSN